MGERAQEDERAQQQEAARRQEQAVERSPAGASQPGGSVVDERASSSNTQHAGGLTGGSPSGPPTVTPERAREDRRKTPEQKRDNPTMPGDEETLRTEI
jgi:hypothetical protein